MEQTLIKGICTVRPKPPGDGPPLRSVESWHFSYTMNLDHNITPGSENDGPVTFTWAFLLVAGKNFKRKLHKTSQKSCVETTVKF